MRRTIARKRDGEALAAHAWHEVVAAFLAGRIDDAQMSALLMACVLRGMTLEETFALTEAFVRSGETLVAPDPRTVDKHSSGGVADTASLVVVPLVAACGVPVAKLSGGALGHTGGTLDKLEAIEGVRTDLGPERFFAIVREVGCAIAAASSRLAPADKRIYALRDRTATVPSLGLIGASIVSKKIAGGAHAIVYDVKVGRGAFLHEVAAARELAEYLVALTERFGRRAVALVTDMDEPLGRAIGTGLEAIEARDFLRGTSRDPRLGAVVRALGSALLAVAGVALRDALESGAAYERFDAMLAAQGAVPGALERLAPHAARAEARAHADGFVRRIDAVALGELARELTKHAGSGAGLIVRARTGCAVQRGDTLVTVFGDAAAAARASEAFEIGSVAPPSRPLVYCEIGSRDAAPAAGSAAVTAPRSMLESR
jgi:pyrimidine-nucleoside phosphorylase